MVVNLALSVAFCASPFASGQLSVAALSSSGQQSVGSTSTPYADRSIQATVNEAKVDKVFERYSKHDGPGCAVAVLKSGDIVYANAYGLASVEGGIPLRTSSIFNIGSMSKQFTALSILLLERSGKLTLNDDIRKYVPELPSYPAPITIRNLLEHSSGLRDVDELLKLAGFHIYEDLITNRDELNIIAHQRALNFVPGEEHAYSDTGFMLLGQIVERVSGMSLRQFETDNIFRPLGMDRTLIREDHTIVVPENTAAYIRNSNGDLRTGGTNDESTGAGNVLTSIADYAKWDRNFYTHQVGGPDLLVRMQTPGLLKNGMRSPYALGLQVRDYRGLMTLEHGGADAGYHSFYLRIPEQQLSVVALCNVRDYAGPSPSEMSRKIADIYLEDVPGATPTHDLASPSLPKSLIVPPKKEWEDYVGSYFSPQDGSVIAFLLSGEALSEIDDLTDPKSSTLLTYLGSGRFQAKGKIVFRFKGKGRLAEVEKIDADERLTFGRVSPPSTTVHALDEFAGGYTSNEVGSTWTLVQKNGHLVLRRPRFPDETLVPVFRDGFYAEQWTIVFLRSKQGKVIGLNVTNERVRAVSFEKTGSANPCLSPVSLSGS